MVINREVLMEFDGLMWENIHCDPTHHEEDIWLATSLRRLLMMR
jgi:hypothetical protein